MGWTRKSVAATILQVTEEQKRELASRLAARMDECGLTNEGLAYKSGVSVKTVSRILNSRHDPRIQTIEKLAKAVDWTEQDLRGIKRAPLGLDATVTESIDMDALFAYLKQVDAKLDRLLAATEIAAPETDADLADALEQEQSGAVDQDDAPDASDDEDEEDRPSQAGR